MISRFVYAYGNKYFGDLCKTLSGPQQASAGTALYDLSDRKVSDKDIAIG